MRPQAQLQKLILIYKLSKIIYKMSEFVTLQISAKIYCGFQYKIHREIISKMTIDEIINEFKIYMKNFFEIHNLYILKDGIDPLILHIHDDIPFTNDIVYLCDHKH